MEGRTYLFESSVDALPERGQVAHWRRKEAAGVVPGDSDGAETEGGLRSRGGSAEPVPRLMFGQALSDYLRAMARWKHLAESDCEAARTYRQSLPAHYEDLVVRRKALCDLMGIDGERENPADL